MVAVQYALGRLGYLKGKADGSFGGMTQAAVEDFQQAQGLPVTGKVNNTTLAALDKAVGGSLRPHPYSLGLIHWRIYPTFDA